MIIVSKIIHVKVDRRLNVFQVVLLLSCFVGHPVYRRYKTKLYSAPDEQSFLRVKVLMQEKLFQRCTHFCTVVYCLWAEK